MSEERFDQSIDELLADLHQLLDDEPSELYDSTDFQPEPRLSPISEPKTEAPAPVRSSDPQTLSWTATQKLPRHVAKLQRNQQQAYADWLYEQGQSDPMPQPKKQPRRVQPEPISEEVPKQKKHHGLRNLILFLLVLVLALSAVVVFVLPRQPVAAAGGPRKEAVSTLLLAGTDADGTRTDTLMLLTVDQTHRSIHLVSIPRDTLINGSYRVPKINGVYGVNGGGEEGMDMLLTRVEEIIGFRPDGYVLTDLSVFEDLVNAMGGVEFDVPMDMFYNDPAQDLYIDLRAGKQTLNGEEALGLVRFRSGYADADLGRVQVQRDFLSAMLDQACSGSGLLRAPKLLQLFANHTQSDLTVANYLWLVRAAFLSDTSHISTVTLPGNTAYLSGGSYYVLDPAFVAQTVNVYCNPYAQDITTADLQIRTG